MNLANKIIFNYDTELTDIEINKTLNIFINQLKKEYNND